jgi:Skp family chaperone for outer membrane proteins
MKKLFHAGLFALALLAFCPALRAADFKIATVDWRKTFYSYYKTVAATSAESNAIADRDTRLKGMIADERKGEEDWRQADEDAHNMTRSADARSLSKKHSDDIGVTLRIQNENISNYYTRTEIQFHDEEVEHVTTLTTDIRAVLGTIAKKQGYTLVLDRSTGSPAVLYSSGENDLTDALIKELNSTAPATPAPEPAPPPAAGSVSAPTNSRILSPTNAPFNPRLPSPSTTNTRPPPTPIR